jgi:hypothetical protein
MMDVRDVDDDPETVDALWVGVINGLLHGSGANVQYRITSNIDQCFDQSPYLEVN